MELLNSLMQNKPNAQLNLEIQIMADLARTYSPDSSNNFLSATMPVKYIGGNMTVNEEAKNKWESNFPTEYG